MRAYHLGESGWASKMVGVSSPVSPC